MTGSQLRTIRERLDLSQAELAGILAIGSAELGRWETSDQWVPVALASQVQEVVQQETQILGAAYGMGPHSSKVRRPSWRKWR